MRTETFGYRSRSDDRQGAIFPGPGIATERVLDLLDLSVEIYGVEEE